jgi:hypothetical protein
MKSLRSGLGHSRLRELVPDLLLARGGKTDVTSRDLDPSILTTLIPGPESRRTTT